MSDRNYDSIWKLISQNKFVVKRIEHLTCGLCQDLLVDACQTSCGCQYCYKCIRDYIGNDSKYCPGNKSYCDIEYLALDVNVYRNSLLNKRIITLEVICPNQSCGSSIQLNTMENHLRLCTKQPMECPYVVIGCNTEPMNADKVLTHLNDDTLPHTGILIELIQNMKNEINVLKQNFNSCKLENIFLKDELLEGRDERREENGRLTTTVADLRKECQENIVNNTSKISSVRDQLVDEIKSKANESESLKDRIMCLEEELKHVRQEVEIIARRDIDNKWTMVHRGRNDIDKMKNKKILGDDRGERIILNWIKLCPNIYTDFIWRIEGCSKRIDEDIFSESFYSNNYKVCLCVWISSYDNIVLLCHINRGDDDDNLQWPLKGEVTLTIIDQYTFKAHKTRIFQYDSYEGFKMAFDRPTDVRNICGIGSDNFIKYSSIKGKASVVVDDSIIVSCVILDT